MLKLVCHIVGGREPFAVKIDANELVTDLKTQIKEQNPSLRSCNAMDIQLYQSLKDATWLSAEDLDQMTSDGVMDAYLATIREMKPTDNLAYYFGPNPPPLTKHVHVLGVVQPASLQQGQAQTVLGSPAAAVPREEFQQFALDMREAARRQVEAARRQEEAAQETREALRRQEEAVQETREALRRQEEAAQETQESLRRQEEAIQTIAAGTPDTCSSAALGIKSLEGLEQRKAIANFVPNEEAPAFWSPADQANANGIFLEKAFDAFITPFFNTALANCDMVFVNSEHVAWLPQGPPLPPNTNLKPDGFATHPGMYHAKDAPMDHVHRPSEHVFRFGEPEKQLMDCVVLFESKLRITDAAFGQVVQYLRRLFPTGSASAVLFDLRSFWLITSLKTVILRVEKAHWVDGGSKALFESFVSDHTSPWVRLLTRACSALGVDVVEGGAFLGRGAHGRVFKVERKADKKVLALKLVDSSSKTALFREELALTNAELTCLTARLEHGFVEFPGGAALLVTPVGAPLPRPTTLQEVVNLFDLLRQLHEKNIIHGDPRVPNVIVVKDNDKDKLLWIDLVEAVVVTPGFRTTDAAILTRSILRLLHTSLLGGPLESLINEYGQAPTSENAHRLAIAVFQSTKFSARR
ncbi:hypothetical protein DYB37_012372 [Aphanomyces astaci]|uniref:Crinkler effector protein N-terminal domain-containing protein n=1 Tax=Aphanomyces astaci TaxID=112090 RepID=A0A3R7CNN7_APHAT|nr:hypothetical protein DYB37_012372 [Aphanomyces astaci]